jgi:hypothetical protein
LQLTLPDGTKRENDASTRGKSVDFVHALFACYPRAMANLTPAEKRKLERLLGMGSGYVLGFSNRTFADFVLDSTGRDIYSDKYDYGSGSKANRLRGFWNEEPNGVVAKLIGDLLDYMLEGGPLPSETQPLFDQCKQIVTRLVQDSPVPAVRQIGPGPYEGSCTQGNIFINYRRDDDPGFAHALFGQLEHNFPAEQLFMDVDYIPAGADFVQVLETEVAKCDVMLALIGKNWLDARGQHGVRRLDDPADFVRIEIEAALSQGKLVIPVLIHGAQMPRPEDLPEALRPLARRNAIRLTHERFKDDVRGLVKSIQRTLQEAKQIR